MRGSNGDIDAHTEEKPKETPPTHGNNFATTSTVNFMTMSRNYPRTTSTCTETSKTSTPSTSESLPCGRDILLEANRIKINTYKRRTTIQQRNIRRMSNLLRQLRRDNLLTDEYIAQLSRTMPKTIKLLERIIADEPPAK